MGGAPGIAEDFHPECIPIGIQGGLRKTEIEIRSLAGLDQLRRQQMKAFIPCEGIDGLRIDHQSGGEEGNGAGQPEEWLLHSAYH